MVREAGGHCFIRLSEGYTTTNTTAPILWRLPGQESLQGGRLDSRTCRGRGGCFGHITVAGPRSRVRALGLTITQEVSLWLDRSCNIINSISFDDRRGMERASHQLMSPALRSASQEHTTKSFRERLLRVMHMTRQDYDSRKTSRMVNSSQVWDRWHC